MTNKTSLTLGRLVRSEWSFFLYGGLMSFWSLLGQTFFISLFSNEIRADLNLSHGNFGGYYAIATLASAATLIWLGKLADLMSVKRLSLLTLGAICLSVLHFSFVASTMSLIFGIYLLRLFGQGMMFHVFSTAIARRYIMARGRALAVTGIGINIAESIGPALIISLLGFYDWRQIWFGIGIFAFITFAPLIPSLTKRTPLQDGLGWQKPDQDVPKSIDDEMTTSLGGMRRTEAIREPVFWWTIIWIIAVPSFTITGLLFHQLYLAEAKGVSLIVWSAHYAFYAVAAVIGAFLSGILVDRFTAHQLAGVAQLPVALAALCLWLAPQSAALIGFFSLFGLASGMLSNTTSALLAERYGTRYLGEIKAMAQPIMVIGSALSPVVMGVMIDAGARLGVLLGLVVIATLVVAAACFVTFNLQFSRYGPRDWRVE